MKNPLTAGQQTAPQAQMPDYNVMFEQFKKNPVEYLIRARFKIPQGMTNPQQIVNHLFQTNQVPRQLQAQIQQMMPRR